MAGGRDREYAVWVTRDELGTRKEIRLDGKKITFAVPERIDGHVVLRLKGLGYRDDTGTGNLLVRIELMDAERGPTGKWSPFRRSGHQRSNGGGNPFSWMNRQQGGSSGPMPPPDDPGRMRRAGFLITGAGLVLTAGASLGILPPAAWMGIIIVVAGLVVAFFG